MGQFDLLVRPHIESTINKFANCICAAFNITLKANALKGEQVPYNLLYRIRKAGKAFDPELEDQF